MRTWSAPAAIAALACLALAGCTAPDAGAIAPPKATRSAQVFSFEGMTGQGGCVFVSGPAPIPVTCQFREPGTELAILGNGTPVSRVSGNVTWTAATPATESVGLFLVAKENGTWVWHESFGAVGGSSPLAFDLDVEALLAAAHAAATETAVRVIELGPASQITCGPSGPVCAGTFAEVGQAFNITGAVVTLASATGSSQHR